MSKTIRAPLPAPRSRLRAQPAQAPERRGLTTDFLHRPAEEIQRSRDPGLELAAFYHGVEHTVLQQKLAALEARRQFLPHGLLDHARPGESDQSVRFGDIEIAQHRETGCDAARGRIGED